MPNPEKMTIHGSERTPMHGAQAIGPTDPHQLVEVSIILEHKQTLPTGKTAGMHMNHEDFASRFGANPIHVDRIRRFAQEHNLHLLERGDEAQRRTVTMAGTAAAMEKAFGVELVDYQYAEGSYRGHTGPIQVPKDCSFIKGVFGLDDRPAARPHFRPRNSNRRFGDRVTNISFNPKQLAQLYNFPTDVNGAGQVIGILELGGGYRPADLAQFFQSQAINPAPEVRMVSVDQARNRPTTPNSADGEVMLDIEVAGSIAPGATIVVYFAPNTDRGFHDALSMAVHDQLRKPQIISISWGGPESSWTQQLLQSFTDVAQEAALLGITVIAASGDSGSSDGMTDGQNHVDFPASCPYVLGAGGTRLLATDGRIASEVAWNDGPQGGASGGGYSAFFTRPAWQTGIAAQGGRGVPDVAGDADPETGYNVLVDGQREVIGGTSAVAPLWAGFIALSNQKLQTNLGCLNPTLYAANESNCFNEITSGNNGAYSAGPGWNPVCGLGTPRGAQLIQDALALKTTAQQQTSKVY